MALFLAERERFLKSPPTAVDRTLQGVADVKRNIGFAFHGELPVEKKRIGVVGLPQ